MPDAELTAVAQRIRAEAFEHSKVMDYAFYLSDVYGPRLTGSPNFRDAGDWAIHELNQLGLANIRKEPIADFRYSWVGTHFSLEMIAPSFSPLLEAPLAWSNGTKGPVTAGSLSERHRMLKAAPEWEFDTCSPPLSVDLTPLTHAVNAWPEASGAFITRRLGGRFHRASRGEPPGRTGFQGKFALSQGAAEALGREAALNFSRSRGGFGCRLRSPRRHCRSPVEAVRAAGGERWSDRSVGRPEEVARVALFLASDDRSYLIAVDHVVDEG